MSRASDSPVAGRGGQLPATDRLKLEEKTHAELGAMFIFGRTMSPQEQEALANGLTTFRPDQFFNSDMRIGNRRETLLDHAMGALAEPEGLLSNPRQLLSKGHPASGPSDIIGDAIYLEKMLKSALNNKDQTIQRAVRHGHMQGTNEYLATKLGPAVSILLEHLIEGPAVDPRRNTVIKALLNFVTSPNDELAGGAAAAMLKAARDHADPNVRWATVHRLVAPHILNAGDHRSGGQFRYNALPPNQRLGIFVDMLDTLDSTGHEDTMLAYGALMRAHLPAAALGIANECMERLREGRNMGDLRTKAVQEGLIVD